MGGVKNKGVEKGIDILNTPVTEAPKAIYGSYEQPISDGIIAGKKVAENVLPDPSKIMNRVARLTPTQANDFKKITKGESHGEYLKRTGNFGTPEQIVENEATKFVNSVKEADTALEQIKGNFKSPFVDTVLEDLVKREKEIGVPSNETRIIAELYNKNQSEGLTMSEINQAKRIYERNVKLGYQKENNTIGIARSTRLDDALRKWQIKTASDFGLKNLDRLNKQTQISKFIIDKLGKQIGGKVGNNALSLTDMIVLSGLDAKSITAFFAKKLFLSDRFKSGVAKILSGNPEDFISADYEKPASKMELPVGGTKTTPNVIQLPQAGVLESQSKLKDFTQTNRTEQLPEKLLSPQVEQKSLSKQLPQNTKKVKNNIFGKNSQSRKYQ